MKQIIISVSPYIAEKVDMLKGDFYCTNRGQVIAQLIREHEQNEKDKEHRRNIATAGAGRPLAETGYTKNHKLTKQEEQKNYCTEVLKGFITEDNMCRFPNFEMTHYEKKGDKDILGRPITEDNHGIKIYDTKISLSMVHDPIHKKKMYSTSLEELEERAGREMKAVWIDNGNDTGHFVLA
jgi:metal-responsive CopG/Arc/MetJ family transcriptional regulator